MKKCPYCGKEVADKVEKCPKCMAELPKNEIKTNKENKDGK